MTSPTSPHLFKDANIDDINFIERELDKYDSVMFIRKVSTEFPDDVIRKYIYEYSRLEDDELKIRDPYITRKIIMYMFLCIIIPNLYMFFIENYLNNIV